MNQNTDCGAQSQRIGLQNTSTCRVQGTFWKRDQKICMSQTIREFSVRLFLLEISEVTPIKSQLDNTSSRYAKVEGKTPTQRETYGKLRNSISSLLQ